MLAGVVLASVVVALCLYAPSLIASLPLADGPRGAAPGDQQPTVKRLSVPVGQAAVVDGATLRVGDRVITLRGVDAPPRGQTCRAGAETVDCGTASAAALAKLVRDRVVECQLFGEDPRGRAQATCEAGGTELNRAQIAVGWARPSP
ncbi:MAG: thermonuclease family protein [Alphaproteobacteria bacterium]|nr:thermonuclease family protein [Alphaproteobacteria bacterium]